MHWILDRRFIDCFCDPVIEGGSLLDAGAGSGIVSCCCIEKGWQVTAVDVSESMLAEMKCPAKKVVASIENLPFSDKSFDVTVCRQVLQYTDIPLALASMLRVTKHEIRLGHIKFSDPCDKEFWKDFFALANPYRNHVFYSGEDFISEGIESVGCNLPEMHTEEFAFDDILVSHIKYPDTALYRKLRDMLLSRDEDFLKRNNVTVDKNGNVYCKRIWSFTVIKL